MKKNIVLLASLLLTPMCKTADSDQYITAFNAAQKGDWQTVYELIDTGNIDVNEKRFADVVGVNFPNNLEVLHQLLNRGADPNALLAAAILNTFGDGSNTMPFVKLLMDNKADYLSEKPQKALSNLLEIEQKRLLDFFNNYTPRHKTIKEDPS